MNSETVGTVDPQHTDTVPAVRDGAGEPSALIWRVYAAGFDTAAVVAPAVLVGAVVGGGGGIVLAVVVGLVVLVGQLRLQGRHGWTVAQRQMSLQVVDHRTGAPIGAGRAAQRLLVAVVPGVLTSAQFDQSGRRRAWHDLLMGTEVIDLGVPRPKKQTARAVDGQATVVVGADGQATVVAGADPSDDAGPGRPAALVWRLYAAMFDLAVVGMPVVAAGMLVSGPSGVVLAGEIGLCLVVAQVALQGELGCTAGQAMMRLRLVDESTGAPAGAGRSLRRTAVVAAGGLVLGVGALVVLVSPRFDRSGRLRGWHDRATGTKVVDMWVPPAPPSLVTGRVKAPHADDVPVRSEPALVIWRMYAAMFDVVAVVVPALLVGAATNAFLAVVTGVGLAAWQLRAMGRHGRTAGQRLMSLRVVDESTGTPIGVGRATQRLFLVAAGGLVLGVGALVVMTSAKFDRSGRRRGWDDLLTGSETIDTWLLRPELEGTLPTARPSVDWDETPRPMTAELVLADGSKHKVGGVVLLGSEPSVPDEAAHEATTLRLPDGGSSVSPTHLRLTVGPIAVWVEDLGSETGSSVRLPDGKRETCEPGRQRHVPVGSVIEVGDAQVRLRKVIDPISAASRLLERRER